MARAHRGAARPRRGDLTVPVPPTAFDQAVAGYSKRSTR